MAYGRGNYGGYGGGGGRGGGAPAPDPYAAQPPAGGGGGRRQAPGRSRGGGGFRGVGSMLRRRQGNAGGAPGGAPPGGAPGGGGGFQGADLAPAPTMRRQLPQRQPMPPTANAGGAAAPGAPQLPSGYQDWVEPNTPKPGVQPGNTLLQGDAISPMPGGPIVGNNRPITPQTPRIRGGTLSPDGTVTPGGITMNPDIGGPTTINRDFGGRTGPTSPALPISPNPPTLPAERKPAYDPTGPGPTRPVGLTPRPAPALPTGGGATFEPFTGQQAIDRVPTGPAGDPFRPPDTPLTPVAPTPDPVRPVAPQPYNEPSTRMQQRRRQLNRGRRY